MSAQTGCAELMRRSNPKNGALLYVGNCIEIARGLHRWFRDSFARQREYDDLTEAAASIRPGADGLIFLPYLMGERTPHPDPLARGGFIGLSVRHNLDHLTRAVLEGVAFGLRDGLDLMTESGAKRPEQIRASGGGIRSKLWRQILADVLGAEIATVTTPEGAAFGAAMLAAVSGRVACRRRYGSQRVGHHR